MNDHEIKKAASLFAMFEDSSARYKKILNFIPSALFTVDTSQRVTFWNKKAESITGISAQDVIGKKCLDIWYCATCNSKCGLFSPEIKKPVFEKQVDITLPDGRSITILKNVDVFTDEHGLVIGGVELFSDITQKLEADNCVRKNLEFVRTLINTIPNPVFFKDNNLRIQECNNAFARQILGLEREQILGLTLLDLTETIPLEMARKYDLADRELLLDGKLQHYECEIKCADGVKRMFRISKARVGTGDGIVGIMLDVTELKELIGKIKMSEQILKEKNQEILNFTDTLSHDLKKPLSVLTNVFGMLLEHEMCKLSNDGQLFVNYGKESLLFMQQMVDDLLEIAHSSLGKPFFKIEDIILEELVDEVLQQFNLLISEKNVSVSVKGLDMVVAADRKTLKIIFMNLIGNALNYIGEGNCRTIIISGELRQRECIISVSDSGIGIPLADQDRIFQKFIRGSNVAGISGTGLGLTIVKAGVEAHHGTIHLESEEGKGTVFIFTIPV